ncbi:MAG TPA: 3-hydroxyacyl-CoA dehydrogenase family protein [Candidatus Deferrimicrobium sp.]|nr:3-hydroxyacyl-CoA dehydrogenase family protein [Candidatus Deferrimicrobium sp.]
MTDEPTPIVERVGRPYVVEAVRMLEAGQGSVADIDAAFESAGYAWGPLRGLDTVGLDVDLAKGDALAEAWDEARFASPQLQRDLVAAGRLGRATGRGFYRYDADGRAVPDVIRPLLSLTTPLTPLTPERIVERLELAVINEAYRAVADGLAAPPAIDRAMRAGAGFPRGPFELVDRLGLRALIGRLRALHEETRDSSGDQYQVAELLWQMATV